MIMEPKFIVADEPISALDVSIRAQVLNLMNKFKEEKNLTYLFIAHDLSVVRFISDRIAVIHLGEIVEIAESETLFKYPLHPYTASLLSAVPMPDPLIEKTRKHLVYDPSVLDQSGVFRVLCKDGQDGKREGLITGPTRMSNQKNLIPDRRNQVFLTCSEIFYSDHKISEKSCGDQVKDAEKERIVKGLFTLLPAVSFVVPEIQRLFGISVFHTSSDGKAGNIEVPFQNKGIDDPTDDQDQGDDGHGIRKNGQSVMLCDNALGNGIGQGDDKVAHHSTGINLFKSSDQNKCLPFR